VSVAARTHSVPCFFGAVALPQPIAISRFVSVMTPSQILCFWAIQ
jgi:hypothetical protein